MAKNRIEKLEKRVEVTRAGYAKVKEKGSAEEKKRSLKMHKRATRKLAKTRRAISILEGRRKKKEES